MALTLKPGPFADNVYLRPPAFMHKLKLRAADYICMEEMKTLRTKFCTNYTPSTAKTDKPPSHSEPRPREPRPPRFSKYALLTSLDHAFSTRHSKQTLSHHHAKP